MAGNDFFSFTQTLFVFSTTKFYKFKAFLFETVPVRGGSVECEITSLFRVVLHHITIKMLSVVVSFGFPVHQEPTAV